MKQDTHHILGSESGCNLSGELLHGFSIHQILLPSSRFWYRDSGTRFSLRRSVTSRSTRFPSIICNASERGNDTLLVSGTAVDSRLNALSAQKIVLELTTTSF